MGGAARGWAAPSGLLAWWCPPGQPQVPSDGLLPENLEYNFFCNFLGNFTVENFSKFKKLQNFRDLETKVRSSEALNIKN